MAETTSPGDFCFVHAADLHLDTPFKGVSLTAPHIGAALREASLRAFDALVELCVERGAAFLLVAGDVYDGAARGLRAQLAFRDGLQRLSDAGIATFVIHGNHDPVGEGWSAVAEWPELVHFFGSEDVGSIAVERAGRTIATVHGVSYGRRDVTENLALGFARAAGEHGVQIGLLHCNVAGAADGHAPYSPCTLDDLRASGLDYWALGHVHARTVLSGSPAGAEPWVVYSGNLQARSPKPSELGAKGASVAHVRGGRVVDVEAVPCDVVRYCRIEVDATNAAAVEEVRTAAIARAAAELDRADGRSIIVRAELIGRSAVHSELVREGIMADLLDTLREESGGSSEPFIWWDDVADATRAPLDLRAARDGGDFVADLLATSDALGGGSTGAPALPAPAAALFGDELLDELLGKMPTELRQRARAMLETELTAAELIDLATEVALDHVEDVA